MKQATLTIGMLMIAAFAVSSAPTAEALCYQDYVSHNGLRQSCPNTEGFPPADPVPSVDCRVGLASTGCTPGPGSEDNRVRVNTTTPVGPAPDFVDPEEQALTGVDDPCLMASPWTPTRTSCHGPSGPLFCGKPESAYLTVLNYSKSNSGVVVYPGAGTTAGPDLVIGSDFADYIDAGNGDDCVLGGKGNDQLYGGGGNDGVEGGEGDDTVAGTYYGPHPAHPTCGSGLVPGNDIVFGGNGNDLVVGCGGNDRLDGGAGNDVLMGFGGNDLMRGRDGDDTLWVDHNGNVEAYPGTPGTTGALGDGGKDVLYGSIRSDRMYGGPGPDFLYGRAGDDRLYGGDENDWIEGEAGNDVMYGGPGGADVMLGYSSTAWSEPNSDSRDEGHDRGPFDFCDADVEIKVGC